uniref:Uncharacterized protein n=1 Tax=Panagrolaimus sp. ES5 TaxID=591445 RepID=A0AC34FZ68_9BILA
MAFYGILTKLKASKFTNSSNVTRLIYCSVSPRYPNVQCATTFESEQCPSETQWVGGFGPVLNASELPLAVQCCEYEPLKLSEDRGVAVVNSGQIVIGGEVLNNGRQYAFDYISDVVKHTAPDGKVSYDVSIRRLPCLPYPTEFTVNVDKAVHEEMLRRFGKDGSKKSPPPSSKSNSSIKNGHARAYQAPTRNNVDNDIVEDPQLVRIEEPAVENIEGPFVAENDAVIETANALPPGETAIQGIELPAGQVPNIINPP